MQTIQTGQVGKQFRLMDTPFFYNLNPANDGQSIGPPRLQPDSEEKKPEDGLPIVPDTLDEKDGLGSKALTH